MISGKRLFAGDRTHPIYVVRLQATGYAAPISTHYPIYFSSAHPVKSMVFAAIFTHSTLICAV